MPAAIGTKNKMRTRVSRREKPSDSLTPYLGSWSQPEDWVLGLGSWGRRRPDFLGLKRLKCEKLPFFSFRFPAKITRRTLSSLPFWYASELDSDVGLGESHRFFGYNTKLSVTYGAQSARRNF